jgi:ribosomal protein S18 acetylase RimI-like enzyme
MKHVLDNPAWNALISGNKHLSNGDPKVKYFDKEVSPFVGLEDNFADSFRMLYEMIAPNEVRLFVTPAEIEIPAPWKVLNIIKGLQMVCADIPEQTTGGTTIIPLTEGHVSQMLSLTKLTNPGPFAERTIDFGHYEGIFEGDKLVAMAGQRMHAFSYAEISAVCTHPGHTGHGYARQLLLHQLHRIKEAGNIPFLHVRYDNERAIKVYENLGFETRTEVYFYVIVNTLL